MEPRIWSLVVHPEYDKSGCGEMLYELTDGRTSIYSRDDDTDALSDVVHALNCSDCSFHTNDWHELENRMLRDDVEYLNEIIIQFKGGCSEQI